MLGGIIIRHLVEDLGVRLEGAETVGEADRHPKLTPIGGGEFDSDVFSKSRRRAPDVDGDVENAPARDPHQFALRARHRLKVQPPNSEWL